MRWGLILSGAIALVIAGYLGTVLWFFARLAAEQRAHVRWQYSPGGAMADLAPDILPDGTLCCGAGERLNWISPDGEHLQQYDYSDKISSYTWWAGAGGLWYFAFLDIPRDGQFAPPSAQQRSGARLVPAEDIPVTLLALDKSAAVAWQASVAGWAYPTDVFFSERQVYLALDNGALYAFDLAGRKLWEKQISQQHGAIGADPAGAVYYTNDQHYLVALNPDGSERWAVKLGGHVSARPAICGDGTLYLLDDQGDLHAVSPAGKLKWRFRPTRSAPPGGSALFPWWGGQYNYGYIGHGYYPACGPDGTAYFTGDARQLYAVAADGRLKWRREIGGEATQPAVGRDGTVYVAVAGRGVIAYTPGGKIRWRNRGVKEISSAPVIGPDGTLYVETVDSLVAFDP